MTLATLKKRIVEIERGEYEHWAFDPRVDRSTAVDVLKQQVRAIAWQPWARTEASSLLAGLDKEQQS